MRFSNIPKYLTNIISLVQIRSQTQPSPVEGLTAIGRSSHQIKISWTAYTAANNEVQGFRVCLSRSSDPAACETLVPVSADLTTVTIPFLDTFTLYYISIEVRIADEFSVPSYTQARTLERGYYYYHFRN